MSLRQVACMSLFSTTVVYVAYIKLKMMLKTVLRPILPGTGKQKSSWVCGFA